MPGPKPKDTFLLPLSCHSLKKCMLCCSAALRLLKIPVLLGGSHSNHWQEGQRQWWHSSDLQENAACQARQGVLPLSYWPAQLSSKGLLSLGSPDPDWRTCTSSGLDCICGHPQIK